MSKGRKYSKRHEPLQDRSHQMIEWIVEAALKLFSEIGYETTTTNKIAELAGVSIGSLYYYFPNKESILVELGKQHRKHMHNEVRHIIENSSRTEYQELLNEIVRRLVKLHKKESLFIKALVDSTLVDKYLDNIELEDDMEFWSTIEKLLEDKLKIDCPKRATFLIKKAAISISHSMSDENQYGSDEEIIEELSQMISKYLFK